MIIVGEIRVWSQSCALSPTVAIVKQTKFFIGNRECDGRAVTCEKLIVYLQYIHFFQIPFGSPPWIWPLSMFIALARSIYVLVLYAQTYTVAEVRAARSVPECLEDVRAGDHTHAAPGLALGDHGYPVDVVLQHEAGGVGDRLVLFDRYRRSRPHFADALVHLL